MFIGTADKAVRNLRTASDLDAYEGNEGMDGRAVKVTSGLVVLATDESADIAGVLYRGKDGSSEQATCTVLSFGPAQFRLGETIAAYDRLIPNGSGLWIKDLTGTSRFVAHEAGVENQLISGEIGAPGGIFTAEATLTAAQVQALNATAVEVIAAPGAGKYIEFLGGEAFLDFESVGYDAVAATDYLSLRYTNASGAIVTANVSPAGFGDASADAHMKLAPASHVITQNAALVAHIQGGEWYSAAGDSPIVLRIQYRIVTAQD